MAKPTAPKVDLSALVSRLAQLHATLRTREGELGSLTGARLMAAKQQVEALTSEADGLLSVLNTQYNYRLSLNEYLRHGRAALRQVTPWRQKELDALVASDLPLADSAPAVKPVNDPSRLPPPGRGLGSVPEPKPRPAPREPNLPSPEPLPMPESPDEEATVDVQRALEDFEYFCSHVLTIAYRPGVRPGEQKSTGFFEFTQAQRELARFLVENLLIKELPLRVILLKARQLGFTTLLWAFWVWMSTTNDSYHTLFIIDKHEHNTTKMRMVRKWVEEDIPKFLPRDAFAHFKSQPGNQIVLTNGSVLFFESSDSKNPGSSEMVRFYHESEMPKWIGGKGVEIRNSVLPGLPIARHTAHVNESTALGLELFHSIWEFCNRPTREPTDPIPLFFGWHLSPEYQLQPPPEAYAADGSFLFRDDEEAYGDETVDGKAITEREYAKLHKLTFAQVYWRRVKISTDFKGNRAAFDQEYPTTPRHAFRSAGRNYFPVASMDEAELLHVMTKPKLVGRLLAEGIRAWTPNAGVPTYNQVHPYFTEEVGGPLEILELPIAGERYYLGGDVAEGKVLVQESGKDDPDWTIFGVRRADGIPCAYYKTRIEPEQAWLPLLLLALWYNQALVNVEGNGPGQTLLSWFWETRYPRNLIWPEPKARPAKQRAWTTLRGETHKRDVYLSLLRSSIQTNAKRIRWGPQLAEYRAFQRHPRTGRAEARSGAHDDIVFADLHAEIARMYDQGFLKAQSVEDDPVTRMVLLQQRQRPPAPEGFHYVSDSLFDDGTSLGEYLR